MEKRSLLARAAALPVLHFLSVGRASLFQRVLMLLAFSSALTPTGPEKNI